MSVGAFLDESDLSLEEMKNRQNAALTSITSSSAPEDKSGRGFHILPVIEPPDPTPSCPPPPVSNLMAEFERMTLHDDPAHHAHQGAELSSVSSDEYFLAPESPGGEGERARVVCSRSRSWDHGSSASSASYRSMEEENDLIVTTPPRVRKGLFIEG